MAEFKFTTSEQPIKFDITEDVNKIVNQTAQDLRKSAQANTPSRSRRTANGWRVVETDSAGIATIRNIYFPPRIIWLEYGTRTRLGTGRRVRGRRKRTRSFNFVRPLFDNAKAELYLQLKRNLK